LLVIGQKSTNFAASRVPGVLVRGYLMEFQQERYHQTTRVPGLPCAVDCVMKGFDRKRWTDTQDTGS